jgi:branched-chain amino acid transport system permease protein
MRAARIISAVAVVTVLIALPYVASSYYLTLATRILIFAIFAMSLDLLMGYTGLPSLGHAAFLGMGSYSAGLIALHVSESLPITLGGSVLASAALAAFFGVLLLRSSRNRVYFMMLTLALSQVLWALAFQWRSLTHGDDGLTGIPRPFIGSLPLTDSAQFYWFTAVIFVVSAAILLAIVHSPFGLTLKGMRESPSRMSALGYDVWLHQYITFIIAGIFAGLAGALLVFQNGIASPGQLSVATSAEALLMVILGGAGTMLGPALGSVIVVLLEFLVSEQTERWMSVLGVIYVLVVLGAPGGIFPLMRTAAQKLLRRHSRPAASEGV